MSSSVIGEATKGILQLSLPNLTNFHNLNYTSYGSQFSKTVLIVWEINHIITYVYQMPYLLCYDSA